MNWINFPLYAYSAGFFWLLAAFVAILPSQKIEACGKGILLSIRKIASIIPAISLKRKLFIVNILSLIGLIIMGMFIADLWVKLDRPPMRTLGETRLWYAFFLPFIGLITLNRWKYGWFVSYTNLMALVFLLVNLFHPENYSKTLMPALQSPWFVPHVIVYIFSYAMLGVSSFVAFYGLILLFLRNLPTYKNPILVNLNNWVEKKQCKDIKDSKDKKIINSLNLADNLVYTGFAFLTLGLLFGALWAKQAWGHYWTWDPKETWAMLTFLMYLIYMHFRIQYPKKAKIHLWILAVSFSVLLLAWFGVNSMPSSKNSVHTYSQEE